MAYRTVDVTYSGERFRTEINMSATTADILSAMHRELDLPGEPADYIVGLHGSLSVDGGASLEIVSRLGGTGKAVIAPQAGWQYEVAQAGERLDIRDRPFAKHSGTGGHTSSGKTIFVSHSHEDEKLSSALVSFLVEGVGIPSDDILCTSVAGYSIPAGTEDPVSYLRDTLAQLPVVVVLATRSFLSSTFCMFETGAAWALGAKRFIVAASNVDFRELPTVLRVQAAKLDKVPHMLDVGEEIARHLHLPTPKAARVSRMVEMMAGIRES